MIVGIRISCSCGYDEFDIKGGGDCPECGKDLNNCVWSDDQAITYYLEEQSMNELSSVTANGSPVLRISIETYGGGSWQAYIHWDTKLHPDKTRVLELQRRVSLGLDIFNGEEIDE
jgi:hypothetical protein